MDQAPCYLLNLSTKIANCDRWSIFISIRRMHSSRMCTACLLPISRSMHCSGWVYLVHRGSVPGLGGVPGLGECTWSRGVYLVWGRGVYLVQGVYVVQGCTWSRGCTWSGAVPGPGVYLVRVCTCLGEGGVPGLGVYLPGGVPTLRGVPACGVYLVGVYLVQGEGCTWSRGVYLPRYSPLWTDRHV